MNHYVVEITENGDTEYASVKADFFYIKDGSIIFSNKVDGGVENVACYPSLFTRVRKQGG